MKTQDIIINENTIYSIKDKAIEEIINDIHENSHKRIEITFDKEETGLKLQECIAEIITKTEVTSLKITTNNNKKLKINEDGASDIAIALVKNTTLQKLQLADITIDNKGAILLYKALKTNNTLNNLDVSNTKIDTNVALHISIMLQKNTALTHLDLSKNPLTNESIEWIAKALEKNNSLVSLDLTRTKLSTNGVNSLSSSLKINKNLEILTLASNDINEEGAFYLAEALKQNSTLEQLDLSCNFISNIGAADIVEALKINNFLTNLDLTANQIGTEVGIIFADTLLKNTMLHSLTLTGNPIKEATIEILKALKENTTLKILNLNYTSGEKNYFHDNGKTAIIGKNLIVELGLKLTTLNLEGCDFTMFKQEFGDKITEDESFVSDSLNEILPQYMPLDSHDTVESFLLGSSEVNNNPNDNNNN